MPTFLVIVFALFCFAVIYAICNDRHKGEGCLSAKPIDSNTSIFPEMAVDVPMPVKSNSADTIEIPIKITNNYMPPPKNEYKLRHELVVKWNKERAENNAKAKSLWPVMPKFHIIQEQDTGMWKIGSLHQWDSYCDYTTGLNYYTLTKDTYWGELMTKVSIYQDYSYFEPRFVHESEAVAWLQEYVAPPEPPKQKFYDDKGQEVSYPITSTVESEVQDV